MENVYTVRIGGFDLSLYSSESAEYTNMIATEVDRRVKEITSVNPSISLTNAALLVAMDLADELFKLETGTDNMRAQLKDYLDDTTKALAERDEARRMAERLKDELLTLKIELSGKK
ncbi:MAG: cell division protein ZapA [Clostridia bacterium]|nr:cell division protein ZapA [Clostridia bacterium]